MTTIFRVQHRADGRGPYRPGFSKVWLDNEGHCFPTWFEEFGHGILRTVPTWQHIGSGFRTINQLNKWFSETELEKLASFGYWTVSMEVDRVLGESDLQLVFCRTKTLRNDVIEIPSLHCVKGLTA